jgi:hypothetical protein
VRCADRDRTRADSPIRGGWECRPLSRV